MLACVWGWGREAWGTESWGAGSRGRLERVLYLSEGVWLSAGGDEESLKGFTDEVNHCSDFGCEEDSLVDNGVVPEVGRSGRDLSCEHPGERQ